MIMMDKSAMGFSPACVGAEDESLSVLESSML